MIFNLLRRKLYSQIDYGVKLGILFRLRIKFKDYKKGDGRLELRLGAIRPVLKPDGQWTDMFLNSKPELQRRKGFETMYCVTASAIRQIVLLAKALFGHSLNLSERFNAKLNGTTTSGNTGQKVADGIRRDGVVDEEEWPWPLLPTTWAEFYKEIPQITINKGKKFLQFFKIADEWIKTSDPQDLMNELRFAPPQVYVKAWFQDSKGLQYFPTGASYNHACLLLGYLKDQYWIIGDQYEPYIKKVAWDQKFYPYAKRFSIVKLQDMSNEELLQKAKDKYIMRTDFANGGRGQVYKFTNDQLQFLDSQKQENNHIPLVDSVINDVLKKDDRLLPVSEADWKSTFAVYAGEQEKDNVLLNLIKGLLNIFK